MITNLLPYDSVGQTSDVDIPGLKPRCWQDWFLLKAPESMCFLAFSSLWRWAHSLAHGSCLPFKVSQILSLFQGQLISILNSTCNLNLSLSCNLTSSQVLEIRTWTSLEAIVCPPTLVFLTLLHICSLNLRNF